MISVSGFERPDTTAQLLRTIETWLKHKSCDILFLAGGTDVVPTLRRLSNGVAPALLVSLTGISELQGVELLKSGNLRLGALTRLSQLASLPLIAQHIPVLAATADKIASLQIRNQATVGGNLLVNHRCVYFNQSEDNRCAHGPCFKAGGDMCQLVPVTKPEDFPLCRARFVSDLAAVMVVLGARMDLVGPRGKRQINSLEFYHSDGMRRNLKANDEVLTSVEIPMPAPSFVAYEKLRIREAIDFPSVGVAVGVTPRASGVEVRVCHVGLNTFPVMLESTDNGLSDSIIERVVQAGMQSARPLRQDLFSPSYRREMVGVFIRRLLLRGRALC